MRQQQEGPGRTRPPINQLYKSTVVKLRAKAKADEIRPIPKTKGKIVRAIVDKESHKSDDPSGKTHHNSNKQAGNGGLIQSKHDNCSGNGQQKGEELNMRTTNEEKAKL